MEIRAGKCLNEAQTHAQNLLLYLFTRLFPHSSYKHAHMQSHIHAHAHLHSYTHTRHALASCSCLAFSLLWICRRIASSWQIVCVSVYLLVIAAWALAQSKTWSPSNKSISTDLACLTDALRVLRPCVGLWEMAFWLHRSQMWPHACICSDKCTVLWNGAEPSPWLHLAWLQR